MLTRKRIIVYSLNGHDTPLSSSILLPYGGQKHMFPKSAIYFSFGQNFVSIHHHNHHMKSKNSKKGYFQNIHIWTSTQTEWLQIGSEVSFGGSLTHRQSPNVITNLVYYYQPLI